MNEIVGHYGQGALLERLVAAIQAAGIDIEEVTIDDLAPVDEFHIGGRSATEGVLERASIPAGARVLDIGSGVGGTARHVFRQGASAVTGVDITPEYVAVACALTEMVGVAGSVRFQQADVCSLPFRSASFDAAMLLHVGMNIDDKHSAFAEVARVLVDGGVFAVYDIMGAEDAPFDYPVPWASSPAGSFLADPDQYVHALETAGFQVSSVNDRSEFAKGFFARLRHRTGPPPPLGLHLLMGDEAAVRYGNMVAAVEAGAIAPFEIVASIPRSAPPTGASR